VSADDAEPREMRNEAFPKLLGNANVATEKEVRAANN
jgi:hypothetical protein